LITPNIVIAGDSATATIGLTGLAAVGSGGLTIQVTTDSTVASIPSSVLVAEGKSSVSFKVSTDPTRSSVTANVTVTLGANSLAGQIQILAKPVKSAWPMFRGNGMQTAQGLGSGAKGVLKWKFKANDSVRSSPVIGLLGMIYAGSLDGYVYALNGADGTLAWKYKTGDKIYGAPSIGPDGTVYVASDDHFVYALNGFTGGSNGDTGLAGKFTTPFWGRTVRFLSVQTMRTYMRSMVPTGL
jgi:PQQ enzyme repeat